VSSHAFLAQIRRFPNKFSKTFTSTFNATETPMVDDGGWTSQASGMTRIRTSTANGGIAFPNDTGGDDDSYAYRNNWGSNDYSIKATVWRDPSLTAGDLNTHELELHFHVSDSASGASLYEIDFAHFGGDTGYSLVRWDNYNAGGGGSATVLSVTQDNSGFPAPLADGYVIKGDVYGTIIGIYLSTDGGANFTLYAHYDFGSDATKYMTGNPGIGCYTNDNANANLLAFRDVTITT
jgi:hypothetical protein